MLYDKNMIEIRNKSLCSGCTACQSICPKKCIEMLPDNEGYLYPLVNKSVCIDCKLCEKVCPLQKPIVRRLFETQAFAVQHLDFTIREQSSSGGAFSAFATCILKRGGVVFGGCFDEDFTVRHGYITSENELSRFRGSKYVQSELSGIFDKVKYFLENGYWVLYSGTPCQVNGLRSFLQKKYDKLVLLDLVCHGTPSPKVWKKYLSYYEEKMQSKLKYVSFRDKHYGYAGSTMALGVTNGKMFYSGRDVHFFKHTFFADLNNRPSCFSCHFKTVKREADITLYDCWHVGDYNKSMDDDKGTTMVLIHSEEGLRLFEEAKSLLRYCSVDVTKAIRLDGIMAISSPKPNSQRKQFFIDVDALTMPQLIERYFPLTFKKRLVFIFKPLLSKMGLVKFLKRLAIMS